jgi:hypothetical protein
MPPPKNSNNHRPSARGQRPVFSPPPPVTVLRQTAFASISRVMPVVPFHSNCLDPPGTAASHGVRLLVSHRHPTRSRAMQHVCCGTPPCPDLPTRACPVDQPSLIRDRECPRRQKNSASKISKPVTIPQYPHDMCRSPISASRAEHCVSSPVSIVSIRHDEPRRTTANPHRPIAGRHRAGSLTLEDADPKVREGTVGTGLTTWDTSHVTPTTWLVDLLAVAYPTSFYTPAVRFARLGRARALEPSIPLIPISFSHFLGRYAVLR